MKKTLLALVFAVSCLAQPCLAQEIWEKDGDFYFLAKNSRKYFSAKGPGSNTFAAKFLDYEGIAFLAKAPDDWPDYGRIDLTGNKAFSLPIETGSWIAEVHFLAGGSYGNSYDDPLLKLYGANYYYSTVTVIFAYQDGSFETLSVPVFWDWFRLGRREWSKNGARVKGLGENPVRKDCAMYHLSFTNPYPEMPLRDILVTDSWLDERPFTDIFAVTIKSSHAR